MRIMKQFLDVESGRAVCPECNRKVKVNFRRNELYSHSKPGSAELCSLRAEFRFNRIEVPEKEIPRKRQEALAFREKREENKRLKQERKREQKRRSGYFLYLQEDPYPEMNWPPKVGLV